MGMDLAAAIDLDASSQALLMLAEDHREFYAAWSEKRPPQWTGR
jgi:hypothetical protein